MLRIKETLFDTTMVFSHVSDMIYIVLPWHGMQPSQQQQIENILGKSGQKYLTQKRYQFNPQIQNKNIIKERIHINTTQSRQLFMDGFVIFSWSELNLDWK